MEVEKEEIILEAANKIFLKYGYQKTSMDDIAKEAMIGKGTIYYYFNSKEDIFVALLRKADHDKSLKKKIDMAKTFEEKYQIFMIEPFNIFVKHSKLIVQVMNDESPSFLKKIVDFKQESLEFKKSCLLEIFMFGKANNQIKDEHANNLEKIVDVTFKWIMISGEYVRINLSEDTIDEIKADFLFMSKVFLDGLIKN